ncbi:hypothetical protein [Nitrososphaera viennensis]|uniref:Uncharacterized protein n=2 Tax=Nitrososphaera viennensis TaxID=1034015 RepID=A0A060HIT7_9ARCH|nr:hypothetical protein [Nitrososphaera viennensis]AIC15240.1 hypothetical protein NVIE_010140 [Nitrososphaera viennensis EN76]UVS70155.1 hypothetical protein NWT39_05040 [Nitrososphaera viennensis]
MPDRGDNSVQISGDRLKALLEKALAVFGDPGKEYIMEDLVRHGIKFDSRSHYTLAQVQDALSILGEDGAALVIGRVRRELERA